MNDTEQSLLVLRGEATDEELAALAVVLLTLGMAGPMVPATWCSGGPASWRQQAFRAAHSWQE